MNPFCTVVVVGAAKHDMHLIDLIWPDIPRRQ